MKVIALIFGIVLLIVGLVAASYSIVLVPGYDSTVATVYSYPYQTVGIVLIIAGVIFAGLGLFYSPQKTNNLPPRAMTNCPVCNKTISSENNFCPYCATDLKMQKLQQQPK